ncbi:radical SAM protein [Halapricum desulfuricans]|uniref:Wybutosine (YW) biosynthesis enzyme-like protein, Fe-S oxidoreductase n=1 Tax=Halapricum desulfuricans TaxID=2841257 RepID=A0A897MX31_9EURY|nr:radical SAM protein [Halapricum desulfuricans]QSG06680.1 Wybutosine (yW) biosynthesis enzyme-like protein, Fe-S oxidoreductase [Halapricum desulfuricans]
MELAYGPVPSRRLGQSLGVNTIPPKTCSYACVYCQLGRTTDTVVERDEFFSPEEIFEAVSDRVEAVRAAGESIDYLSIVPDGEPTLDVNLGATIDRLQDLEIDVAVISNGSLLADADVRAALAKADWVSLKADAGTAEAWRAVDRPNKALSFASVVEGMRAFADAFEGTLTTETMLVDGRNDDESSLQATVDLVASLGPDTAYIAVPTRPPAEEWVEPAGEQALAAAYSIFEDRLEHVEYLIGAEGATFAATGDVRADILGVTAVHPMRETGLRELLDRDEADWAVVEELLEEGSLLKREFGDETFYLRPIETMDE